MFRLLFLCCLSLVGLEAFAQVGSNCCEDCTCAHCADIVDCDNFPDPTVTPAGCDLGGAMVCGTDHPTTECIYWWENNTQGVQSDTPQPTDPNGCIPIDGGLGFLIAGGLGIGVVGIRRRKEQPLLKRA